MNLKLALSIQADKRVNKDFAVDSGKRREKEETSSRMRS